VGGKKKGRSGDYLEGFFGLNLSEGEETARPSHKESKKKEKKLPPIENLILLSRWGENADCCQKEDGKERGRDHEEKEKARKKKGKGRLSCGTIIIKGGAE